MFGPHLGSEKEDYSVAAGLDCPALAIVLLVMSFGTLCEAPVKSCAAAGHESKQFQVVFGTYVVG